MKTVSSRDGTMIAVERTGSGPAVVLVGGAFSYRTHPASRKLASALASQFTVYNYDRRGRGDSGDTHPYAVEREIEDLDAVIQSAGGSAAVFGMSSGAVLALRGAASGLVIERLAVYQPPFAIDARGPVPPADLPDRLEELLAAGRRSEVVKQFMTKAMGMPGIMVALFRILPMWSNLTAVAHTLPYDQSVMGDTVSGRPLDAATWARVTIPTLVISGGRSPAPVHAAAAALLAILPAGEPRILEGQSHNVSMGVLAAAVADFFAAPAVGFEDRTGESRDDQAATMPQTS